MTPEEARVVRAALLYVWASGTVPLMNVPRSTVNERKELWDELRASVEALDRQNANQ